MKSLMCSLAAFGAVLVVASSAHAEATPIPRPTFAQVLRILASDTRGSAQLPAAWAGVWSFNDNDYDCITNDFLNNDTNLETLCTGQELDPGAFGVDLNCTVTSLTDTEIDIDCTGVYNPGFPPGCTVTINFTLVASRNGDALTATSTFGQDYAPACLVPDDCIRTETVGTRVGPEPPDCNTAVEAETWGRVKAMYR